MDQVQGWENFKKSFTSFHLRRNTEQFHRSCFVKCIKNLHRKHFLGCTCNLKFSFLGFYHHYHIIALDLQCNICNITISALGSYRGDAQLLFCNTSVPARIQNCGWLQGYNLQCWLRKFNK